MGIVEWERGRYDEARVQYEAALRTYRELGLEGEAAAMLASLGVTLNAMGRRVEARKCLEEAGALHREAGDRPAEARALGALMDVLRRLGEPGGGWGGCCCAGPGPSRTTARPRRPTSARRPRRASPRRRKSRSSRRRVRS